MAGYKVYTKVRGYNGIRAGVAFTDGIGHTADEHIAEWFRNHGYIVLPEAVPSQEPEPAPEKEPEAAQEPEPAPEKEPEAVQEPEPAPEKEPEAAQEPEPAPEKPKAAKKTRRKKKEA